MRLTVNKLTALHIMREMRASGHVLPRAHVGLLPPDPEPHKRWTKTALQLDALRLSAPPDASHKLYVAVPAQSARLKATFASNTVYEAGLPDDSFADVGGGSVHSLSGAAVRGDGGRDESGSARPSWL